MNAKERFQRFTAKVCSWDVKRKITFLFVLWLAVYGSLMMIDDIAVPALGGTTPSPIDLTFYQNRTSDILHGMIPYRDFSSESPPLIMYLMVPPQALGGDLYLYQIYFCIFPLLTGIAIYLALRRFDDRSSLMAAVFFILSPFAIVEAVFGVQDDMITAFLFVLPLLFMVMGRHRMTSLAIVIGTLTKLFDIILFPLIFLKQEGRRKKMEMLLIVALLIMLMVLPLLILCPEQFLSFPKYYLLGSSNDQTGGSGSISYWHFLQQGGLTLPGSIGVATTAAGLLGSTIYAYWRKLPFWESCTLVVVVFFVVYPKLAFVYYLLPFALLMMWGIEDKRIAARLFLLSIPLLTLAGFSENNWQKPTFWFPYSWLVAFLISLASAVILAQTFLMVRGKRPFFER